MWSVRGKCEHVDSAHGVLDESSTTGCFRRSDPDSSRCAVLPRDIGPDSLVLALKRNVQPKLRVRAVLSPVDIGRRLFGNQPATRMSDVRPAHTDDRTPDTIRAGDRPLTVMYSL